MALKIQEHLQITFPLELPTQLLHVVHCRVHLNYWVLPNLIKVVTIGIRLRIPHHHPIHIHHRHKHPIEVLQQPLELRFGCQQRLHHILQNERRKRLCWMQSGHHHDGFGCHEGCTARGLLYVDDRALLSQEGEA